MRKVILAFLAAVLWVIAPSAQPKAAPHEQEPGKPLYLPKGEYEEHPSDVAPEGDPQWREYEAERQRRIKAGEKVENPYDEPAESVYEETTHYKVVKDKRKHRPP